MEMQLKRLNRCCRIRKLWRFDQGMFQINMLCCRRWVDGFDDDAAAIRCAPDVSAHHVERADGSIARASPSRRLHLSNINPKQSETLDSVSELLHSRNSRNYDVDAGPRFAGDELSRIARTSQHNASRIQAKGDSIKNMQGTLEPPPDGKDEAKYQARTPPPLAELITPHPACAQALTDRIDELSLAIEQSSPSALSGVAWAKHLELVQSRDHDIVHLSLANKALAG